METLRGLLWTMCGMRGQNRFGWFAGCRGLGAAVSLRLAPDLGGRALLGEEPCREFGVAVNGVPDVVVGRGEFAEVDAGA